MTCHRIGGAIVCGPRRKVQKCACGNPHTLLCDWKIEGGTCDEPLCARCTTSPKPGKDLCPAHVKALAEWKASK